MADDSVIDEIPAEMKKKLFSFNTALTELETTLDPLISCPHSVLSESLESLELGKMELVTAYTINSLFWMYLNVCGVNPKEHAVKQELERIRSYMKRVTEIQEKANAPKLNKPAAKRFIKSALWQAAQNKGEKPSNTEVFSAGRKRKVPP
ncbi:nuclear nucleic acid-binding protein C1D-like [Gigantopelta aegis]|uniref:nuclear nucleic acid-binding protein C1D-like n=1 Tax=Gigantopelta aegis TaxID=1735272 RepID=UPI001B889EA3|nr:nuclear nucleic acid-binding protein C1D-like [Gigantopelta aegis]